MGAKQDTLTSMLAGLGSITTGSVRYPRVSDIVQSRISGEIDRVYRLLGGQLPAVPAGFGGWDLEVNGAAIELDEQLHFNRYRAATLESAAYAELPWFPRADYMQYCEQFEGECIRAGSYGGKWTNASCEKQFGPAGGHRDLSGHGAPRWKQRAFYDFVKDLSPLLVGVQVVRISVWDRVPGVEHRLVGETFEARDTTAASAILSLLRDRGLGNGS